MSMLFALASSGVVLNAIHEWGPRFSVQAHGKILEFDTAKVVQRLKWAQELKDQDGPSTIQ